MTWVTIMVWSVTQGQTFCNVKSSGPSVRYSHSVMSVSATPWTAARQVSLSITNSQSLLKLMSIESVMPFNHLIHCHPFSFGLQSSPVSGSFPVSQFFATGGQSIGSFNFSISSSNEYSGLISFRMDCLDLLAVHRTLKSLLQHHSSKASTLQCSTFCTVQLSHPYMTTEKTVALTRWTIFGEVTSRFSSKEQVSVCVCMCNKVLLKYKREKASDIDISRGQKECPPASL